MPSSCSPRCGPGCPTRHGLFCAPREDPWKAFLDSSGHHRAACATAGEGAGSQWSLQPLVLVARLVEESPRTSGSRTWTLPCPTGWMSAVSRSWLTGYPCSMAPSWQWTPPGCPWRAAVEPIFPRCADVDGGVLEDVKRRNERRYPEHSGRHGRTQLVVLAAEVGGKWSCDTAHFLVQLPKAKTRQEPRVLRVRARHAPRRLLPCLCSNAATHWGQTG